MGRDLPNLRKVAMDACLFDAGLNGPSHLLRIAGLREVDHDSLHLRVTFLCPSTAGMVVRTSPLALPCRCGSGLIIAAPRHRSAGRDPSRRVRRMPRGTSASIRPSALRSPSPGRRPAGLLTQSAPPVPCAVAGAGEQYDPPRSYCFSVHRFPPGGIGHGFASFQASTVGLTSLPVTG
jgi:hypothetical protein